MNTTWSLHRIILITLKIITALALGQLHIHYALNAIHPQSILSLIGFMIVLYSIGTTIVGNNE